jgi:hypothetical protein
MRGTEIQAPRRDELSQEDGDSKAGQPLDGVRIRKASESPLGSQRTELGLGRKMNRPANELSAKNVTPSTRARSHIALQSEPPWPDFTESLILPCQKAKPPIWEPLLWEIPIR